MSTRIECQAEPIPGYRLIDRLGGGGFGEVWRVEAPGGLQKAIKFVYGDLSSAGENGQRAEQELKALNRVKTVRHPYILSLERIEIIDGQLMIVMELADRNLWDRFKECRAQGMPGIPRGELLRYLEETAEALDLMNGEYNLQHLDIKPQNVFLIHQHIKVADFGLVKDLEGMQASVTGGVTPVYAAPEIFDGKVSRYSDQYSLAIVYQELLTGQRPFNGTNIRQLILQHMQSPPDLSSLPAHDQAIIGRALAKVPADRYPMCRDLIALLRRGGSSAAIGPSKQLESERPASPTPDATEMQTNPEMPTHMLRPRFDRVPEATRVSSPDALATADESPTAAPPPEFFGQGCLFPALVVGIGQVGMLALQRLRVELHDHFGTPGRVPNVRLLLLDSDPAVMQAAGRERQGATLSLGEVQIAPLGRPSHYIKSRDGKPSVENWLNPRMLYRIPRSQVPSGVRALGRLAFWDNYRPIARRLRQELERSLDPNGLKRAAEETGLGVRSNRPRVYVLAGLGGGTGSGMFLDLAYTVRAVLRQLGYEQPDVVAHLFVPPTEGPAVRGMQLGNTYAALTELTHFSTPGTGFSSVYLDRDGTVADTEPPFTRTVLVRLPEESDEQGTDAVLGRTARGLFHDLCSPLGRASDLTRADISSPRWDQRGLSYHTSGLSLISWPRRELVRSAARKLCQRLVQSWMSKDGSSVRIATQAWIDEQLEERELTADRFIRRLDEECGNALGLSSEEAFTNIVKPLTVRLNEAVDKTAPTGRSGWRLSKGQPELPELPPEAFAAILQGFAELIGQPGDEGTEKPCQVVPALSEAAERLAAAWGQRLTELHVRLIERPGFRLAGAEEGIRHVVAVIEKNLRHYEPLLRDLKERAAEGHAQLQALAAPDVPKNGKRQLPPPQELLELLKSYPKCRYQSLVLQHVITALVGLRGHLSDELREVNFCRVRLTELLRLLDGDGSAAGVAAQPASVPSGNQLFPGGCRTLADATKSFLDGIDKEAMLELDERVEVLLKQDFTALVQVCLSNAGVVVRKLEAGMRELAEKFAGERLDQTDVAEIFLQQQSDRDEAIDKLSEAFEEAAPLRSPPGSPEPSVCVLMVPPGPAGEQLHDLAETAMPGVHVTIGAADSLLIYRETPNLPLTSLEHFGPTAREAYQQMCAAEQFTPHTRCDVAFRKP